PSCLRMRASSFFRFDAGTSTESWYTMLALRIRVNISAIGSVITMFLPPLSPSPTGLDHAWDLPAVGQGAEAHAAHGEPPHVPAGAAADAAPVDLAGAVLGRPLCLGDHRLLGHDFTSLMPPGRASPIPTAGRKLLRRSWPW